MALLARSTVQLANVASAFTAAQSRCPRRAHLHALLRSAMATSPPLVLARVSEQARHRQLSLAFIR